MLVQFHEINAEIILRHIHICGIQSILQLNRQQPGITKVRFI